MTRDDAIRPSLIHTQGGISMNNIPQNDYDSLRRGDGNPFDDDGDDTTPVDDNPFWAEDAQASWDPFDVLAELEELNQRPHWVCWKLKPNAGDPAKRTKVPYDPKTGESAKSNDPSTWGTFDEAKHACASGKYDGIGFVLTKETGLVFVDFDHCISDDGTLDPWVAEWVQRLDTYAEVSQSGRGIHCIAKGTLPPGGRKCNHVEIYDANRYMALTGRVWDGFRPIRECTETLAELHREAFPEAPKPVPASRPGVTGNATPDDEALLAKAFNAKNGAKVQALWYGNTSAYGGDQSDADLALCSELAFWTGPDPQRIDSLFRKSALYRTKWDEKHSANGETYGQMTIRKALARCTDFYDWCTPQHKNNGNGVHAQQATAPEAAPAAGDEALHLTDLGNAERLARRHGSVLRYCHLWHRWLVWDGKRWAIDATAEVERLAKETVRSIYAEAEACTDTERRKAIAAHAMRSEASPKVEAMITRARAELPIPILPDAFDTHRMLFNTSTCTLDLERPEAHPYPHRKEDYITMCTPVVYIPTAECPMWLAFLDRIMNGNDRIIAFLQRAVGYSLTGDTSERCMFILWGKGANGKTTFVETIANMLGDYATNIPPTTLLTRHGDTIPNDLAMLKGKRFVYASETGENSVLDEARIKAVTGGDRISARFMHAEWFEYLPEFKLWLDTNHKPVIRGTDNAIWDRIMLVPFTVRIPEEERDKHFKDKLANELPGILQWALRGCSEWLTNGLQPPPEVRAAVAEYREESDTLGEFLAEHCNLTPTGTARARDLHSKYTEWCQATGERPLSSKAFAARLQERGIEKRHTMHGTEYLGVEIRSLLSP